MSLDYLGSDPLTSISRATALRRHTLRQLRRARSPTHLADTTAALGYQSGVLAYASLDAGRTHSALAHATVAWQAGERAGSDQLRAWARGSQSLISRFAGAYREALAAAEDGLRYAGTGSARARLWCGIAQCHANMGDHRAARRALDRAAVAHDGQRGTDVMPGLFAFSAAKRAYYSGSSLVWLPDRADNVRARREAHLAISVWERAGAERAHADEALAHVYAATASLRLSDLEAAIDDLGPVLDLPPERRISWVAKRMDRVVGMLRSRRFVGSARAAETLDRIHEAAEGAI